MTLFALALAIAACIGWTAHTRVLRRALHEAWAEIGALKAKRDAEETVTEESIMHKPPDFSPGYLSLYWYAVPNRHTRRGGWMPVYDIQGEQRGDTYGEGYDLETALEMAWAAADEESRVQYDDLVSVMVAQKLNTPGSEAIEAKHPLVVRRNRRSPPGGKYAKRLDQEIAEYLARSGRPLSDP